MQKNKNTLTAGKTIVVATDFSKASKNAVNFAAQLAISTKSPLQLLHIYLPPIAVAEGQVVLPSLGELKKYNDAKLKRMSDGLTKKYGKTLNIDFSSKCGMPQDEIPEYAMAKNGRLLLMGLQGAGDLAEIFIGSTTTSVLRKSKTPVITVGNGAKFKPFKKIVFASDYKENYSQNILEPLKTLAKEHKSEIDILHVFTKSGEIPSITEAIEGLKIENNFKGIKHKFVATQNNNIVEGIYDYAKQHKADLIVMIPRKRNFFEKMFSKQNTKQLAFQSKIPLLSLSDK